MREIRTSGLMSGDGKRGNATAPVLDSTDQGQETSRAGRHPRPVAACHRPRGGYTGSRRRCAADEHAVWPVSISAEALCRQRLPRAAVPARPEAGLRADQRGDSETVRYGQVRGVAKTLDRRENDRLAQPVPPPGKGLGVPEPKRLGIPTLGVGSADGPKALSEQQMIPDG